MWPFKPSTTCSGSGATQTTGKPAGNDIRQRKKSMPIVAALAAGDDGADELESLLFDESPTEVRRGRSGPGAPRWEWATTGAASAPPRGPPPQRSTTRATWLVEACGGREWTAARAKAHLDAALGSLERARLSAVPRRALADLAVYVVERES